MSPEMDVEEKILLTLAQNKKRTHYQLWKKDKVAASNKTVLKTLNRLENEEMINSRQEKAGRKRKFYTLTFEGLVACLRYEGAWQSIDKIAEAQKAMLPLVFGKWDFFSREHILDEIIRRFKITVLEIWVYMNTVFVTPTRTRDLLKLSNGKIRPESIKEEENSRRKHHIQVAGLVFGVESLSPFGSLLLPIKAPSWMSKETFKKIEPFVERQKSLLQVLQRDPELKEYIEWRLQSAEKTIVFQLENVKSWRNWFQNIKAGRP